MSAKQSPRVVTIVQARTASSRLPGKVLRPLLDQPLLIRMVERVQAARLVGVVVVATTTDCRDDVIKLICQWQEYHCYRGHPTDLLDRHYQAARQFQADVVVKIPSDCPLIDPAVIDRVLGTYLDNPDAYDYVSNLHPATYPDGNDVEVMRMSALETAWREATQDFEREHTTPFLWERPYRFRLGNVIWETGLNYADSHRWTIDYPEDYDFINAVYSILYPRQADFDLYDILALLNEKPELQTINRHYAGVNWYRRHLADLHNIHGERSFLAI